VHDGYNDFNHQKSGQTCLMGSSGDDPRVLLNIIVCIMVYQGAKDEGRGRSQYIEAAVSKCT
jgi:hypothetical protein